MKSFIDGMPTDKTQLMNIQIIKKDGKKAFAVLPYAEFLTLQEKLEDQDDLRILREAKAREEHEPTVSLDDFMAEFQKTASTK